LPVKTKIGKNQRLFRPSLGREFIRLQISKAIERYRSELEQKSATLKTELSIYAHEQNVGLSRLDEQRSKAIQKIYGLAMRWHDVYMEICQPDEPSFPTAEMKLQKYYNWSTNLVKAAEDISVESRDSAIFFQQDSYAVIANFGMAAMDLSCEFYDNTFGKVDMSKDPDYNVLFPMIEQERRSLASTSQEEFKQLRDLLVAEFRKLMKAEREPKVGQ
ncbi:hypothetical protein, partial [Marinobacter profundi]|uniref:hypothetical protein n=1 Tax=Marinobacter profundi TaxID=2666256 RepID=UPI0014733ECD